MEAMACPVPVYAHKRVLERMNKTMTESKLSVVHNQQKAKMAVLKKIITISSLKQDVKKILIRYLDVGNQAITQENTESILAYSKSILDNEKQKQLSEDLNFLLQYDNEQSGLVFKIIKQLIVSPLERSYITKVQKQLRQDEQIEEQIKSLQAQLEEQKIKKLKDYDLHKSGIRNSSSKVIKTTTTFKEVQNFQNKLMRANQKLNELSCNNTRLREKINQLRKQKNAMQDIYSKLKQQLESKKQNVQKTIKVAGEAYYCRNKAEEDLRSLKEQSQQRKEQFKEECERLNIQIQHDLKFKQFIKSKEIQRQHLQKLQKQIEQNQNTIEQKKQENYKIDQEYKKSLEKEAQIKKAFEKIKKEIGYTDNNSENKELLNIFINLYQKNIIMKQFVQEITKEVEDLQNKIQAKKQQIQVMYLKGTADQTDKERLSQDHKKKFQLHQKKKNILDLQYQKSVSTLHTIKKYLEDIFQQIGIESSIIDKLKSCNLNDENLTQFLGELQKKGLQTISHYGKLVTEQLRAEKGANWQVQKQIDQLNNIITMENISNMNNGGFQKCVEYPSELLIKLKEDKSKDDELDKPLNIQQFKKYAIQSLQLYQKKQLPKQKHLNKKYNITPILMSKSKKRDK